MNFEMKDLPRQQGERVRDRRIERVVELIPPAQILDDLPLGPDEEDAVLRHRSEVAAILDRADDRLMVIVGPCSVHDVDAAVEYAQRLSARASELNEELCITMRVYFEKPRTTTGWKGLINDPHLDGSRDVNVGLHMARRLLLQVLDLGLPIGCEFLDPITPQYISDVVAWGAIGARTTESQTHRQLASGLSMPVGFKNGTAGSVKLAVDAVRAAAAPHAFAGVDVSGTPAILYTKGNSDCHIILRGGRGAPNYDPGTVAESLALLRDAGLAERLVIDASHDNSGKDHNRQPRVVAEIADQIAAGNGAIVGVMMESFLVAGRQDLESDAPLVYGQSITDACMDWETTVLALDRLAAAVRKRRETG
jgi:3-deoxy-7-phosphoheptulonate synthase